MIVFQNKTFRKAWKKFWEPVLGCGILQWIMAILMAVPVWFVYLTSVKKLTGFDVFRKYRNKPAIFVVWHGRSMMLAPIVCLRGMRAYMVASRHKDGRMMAKLQMLFGLRAIYGSSSKGGVSVLRQGLRILRRGTHAVCLSPDGPGGPSLRFHDGALYFAKMSGAPIIPVCYSAKRSWIQKRWDRYLIALPFNKIVCNVGNAYFVPKDATPADFEKIRADLEKIMNKQMCDLDKECGIVSPEQDLTATEFKRAVREAKQKKNRGA